MKLNQNIKYAVMFVMGFIVALSLVVIFKTVTYFWFPSPKQALSFWATDIHIEEDINGFLPDYSYNMKAKISNSQFKKFIKKIGLEKYYNSEKEIYQERKEKFHWTREAYYKDGYIYYSEGQS